MQEFCTMYLYDTAPFGDETRNAIVDGLGTITGVSNALQNEMTLLGTDTKHQLKKMTLRMDDVWEENQDVFYKKTQGNVPGYAVYKVRVADTGLNQYRYYFYYVLDVEWNSMSSIRLSLKMDVLNTFATKLHFSDKTYIVRQHLDRLKTDPIPHISGGHTYYHFIRRIHRKSEGMLANYYKCSTTLYDTLHYGDDELDYSLTYYSNSQGSDEGVTLVYNPSIAMSYTNSVTTKTMTLKELGDDLKAKYNLQLGGMAILYFTIGDNESGVTNINSDDSGGQVLLSLTNKMIRVVVKLDRITGNYDVTIAGCGENGLSLTTRNPSSYITFNGTIFARVRYGISNAITYNDSSVDSLALVNNVTNTYTMLTKSGTFPVTSYNDINKVNPTILKMILIPNPSYLMDYAEYDPFHEGYKVLVNSIPNLQSVNAQISSSNPSPLNPIFDLVKADSVSDLLAISRNDRTYESKAWHSDYYYCKLSYDSFNKIVKLENYSAGDFIFSDWNPNATHIYDIYPSTSFSSILVFHFKNLEESYEENDFSSYLIANRNNEKIIYNNDYINYIKNGYNYDIKNREIRMLQQGTQVAIGGITSAVGMASGSVPGAIIGAISLASNINTMINNKNLEDNAMAQKMSLLEHQKTGVLGSETLESFNVYSKNALRYDYYESENRWEMASMFFFYGYRVNYYDVPSVNTRIWFNFLQCEPVFDNVYSSGVNKDIFDEIVNKFRTGVTYFHYLENVGYNFAQNLENWEVSLYNIVLANE